MAVCILNCDSRHPQSNMGSVHFTVNIQQTRPCSLNLFYIKLNTKVFCNMTQHLWLEFRVSQVSGGGREWVGV